MFRRLPPPNPWLSATVLMWSFNFVAIKLLYQQMTPAALAIVRFVPMYLLLVLLCKLRREPLKYDKESFPVLWQGFIAMGVYMILFLEGMKRASAAEGAIILATAPIFSAILSMLRRIEPFTPGALIGAAIAFLGTALVIQSGASAGHTTLAGVVILLASALMWAYGAVLSKPLVVRYSPLQSFTLSMPAALAILIPYGIHDTLQVPWANLTTQTWLMLLHVTVGAGIIGFVGFYEGVKKIGPAQAMLYQYFVPILAAFFAVYFTHEALSMWQFAGLGIVIFGVAFATRARLIAAEQLRLAST